MERAIRMLDSVTGRQMMSLVITTEDGRVIVIDGGYREDAPRLLACLREVTGQDVPHVDAFWLTHPHSDHMHAFMELCEHHADEWTFDGVYFHFPSVQFIAAEDREYVYLAEFYEKIGLFAHKMHIVSAGDVYLFGEARIDVLYTTDDSFHRNVCNNASTVFRLTLGGKRVLITGDCGVEAGQKLLRLYGAEGLHAEICQMSHHGQNGCDRDFYAAVSPEICLWCTPKWLWDNDAGKGYNTHMWKTVIVRGWMQELGVRENYVTKDGTQIIRL